MAPESHDSGESSFWGLWGAESWQCEPLYNQILEETSEFNKWGSNSASTIMALLPSLMAFAPVITANIGFLCHLSPTQGFIAAAFTFGLPVRQLDTRKLETIRVKDLLVDLKLRPDNVLRPFTEMVDILLAPIKDKALRTGRPRNISVLSLRYLLGYVQVMLIFVMLVFVPDIDTFYPMWLCQNWGNVVFSLWLGATFTLVGWWRAKFERDSFKGDEVIYISKDLGTGINQQSIKGYLEPHPMIIILRPSDNVQINHQHTHYFIGIFQLFWICFLSFLFSSTIGGTLFSTLIMVVVFIAVVAVSRGLSILSCWLAQKYLDLRVIEYDNLQEKKMMQRLLGGLTGVIMDIRWVTYHKTQWQESIKMYRWGKQLSHGNVMAVPSDTKQCTLHNHLQRRTFFWVRMLVVTSLVMTTIVFPCLWVRVDSGERASQRVQFGAGIAITVTAQLGCLHLGRARRLLICNCG